MGFRSKELTEEIMESKSQENRDSLSYLLKYGAVCIDKPVGPTSHEVAAFVRKVLQVGKTGHTGTLDGNVSGCLLVLLNNACKAAHYLPKARKKYVCLMQLEKEVSKEELEKAFSRFRGRIFQKPPLASAVSKKLRVRELYDLKLLELDGKNALFEAETEAGFYIRKLVFDIGEVLGIKSEMKELRRVAVGSMTEEKCVTLQELSDFKWLAGEMKREDFLKSALIPVEKLVENKKVILNDEGIQRTLNGAEITANAVKQFDDSIKKDDVVALLSEKGQLIAFGTATASESNKNKPAVKIERVIVEKKDVR